MEVKIQKSSDTSLEEIIGYNGSIYFGIPRETNVRDESELEKQEEEKNSFENADIMCLMERGSPIMNIPARPWLVPACLKHESEIRDAFSIIFKLIVEGKQSEADKQMDILSQRIETWIKQYMREDNGWAPNSPITIHGGWMRNKISGKPVYVKGKKSTQPLFDTGELQRAIKSIFVKGDK